MNTQHVPRSAPVVDPRLLMLVACFKQCDERGKVTLLRMAQSMPCQKSDPSTPSQKVSDAAGS